MEELRDDPVQRLRYAGMGDAYHAMRGAFSGERDKLWRLLINLDALIVMLSRDTDRSQLPTRRVSPYMKSGEEGLGGCSPNPCSPTVPHSASGSSRSNTLGAPCRLYHACIWV